MDTPDKTVIAVLAPVFNDWESASRLITELENVAAATSLALHVVLVDDGSTTEMPDLLSPETQQALRGIEVVHLRANVGHQRAIATGLVWLQQNRDFSAVAVMDGDGEDRPEDLPLLVKSWEAAEGKDAIFAERAKRLESWQFQFFYQLYRFTHRVLVGFSVRVGNFSILPFSALDRLVVSGDLWCHYAATVFRSRLPLRFVSITRGQRYAGRSKMNFLALVVHGLSAFAVFADVIAARLLVASSLLTLSATAVALWRADGVFAVLAVNGVILSLLLALEIVRYRTGMRVVPPRECPLLVRSVERLHPSP